MDNRCVIAVSHEALANVFSYALSQVPSSRGSGINVVALLLSCAELSILLEKETWCLKEDKATTVAMLRTKALGHAWCVYHQFKDSEPC